MKYSKHYQKLIIKHKVNELTSRNATFYEIYKEVEKIILQFDKEK